MESWRELEGEKILITGGQGPSGFPLVRELAKTNDVFVMARFSDPASRERIEGVGAHALVHDLGASFDDLPRDFGYIYHSAHANMFTQPGSWPDSYDQNVDIAGRLLAHAADAKGFVLVSSASVYEPWQTAEQARSNPIPETGRWGVHGPHMSYYSFSKVAEEMAVGFCSRKWEIPATILRMGSPYGPEGGDRGTVVRRLDMIVRDEEIPLHAQQPSYFRPMYETDIARLGIRALQVGKVPPVIVNFCGDETVSAEEYCAYMGELIGIAPKFRYTETGVFNSLVPDTTLMHELLGKCEVGWREGCRRVVEARYPDLLAQAAS